VVASRAVYLSPDDAKTDVILAAATAVLGVALRGFVATLPLYPSVGIVATVLDLGWIFALTALVPLLLARYRGDGLAAFGLGDGGVARGLILLVPAVALGLVIQFVAGAGPLGLVLGRLAGGGLTALGIGVNAALVLVGSVGTLLLYGFLASRAREGFPRSPDTSLTQLVRTTGLVVVIAAGATGLVRALTSFSLAALVLVAANVVAVTVVLLLVDRVVPVGVMVPRAALVAPVIVLVVAQIFVTGGLFRGDLVGGLYSAALATGVVVAVAASAQTRAGTALAVPLVVAAHWYPTCLSPLTLITGVC
jgi:hypothetical protein